MMVRTPWKHALKHFTSKYQPRPRAFCEIHTRSTCKPTLRGPKTTFPYRRVTRAQKRCICCTSFGDDPGVLTPRAPHPRATRGSLLFSRYRTPGASHRQPQRTMAVYAGTRRRRRSPPRGQAGPGRWSPDGAHLVAGPNVLVQDGAELREGPVPLEGPLPALPEEPVPVPGGAELRGAPGQQVHGGAGPPQPRRPAAAPAARGPAPVAPADDIRVRRAPTGGGGPAADWLPVSLSPPLLPSSRFPLA